METRTRTKHIELQNALSDAAIKKINNDLSQLQSLMQIIFMQHLDKDFNQNVDEVDNLELMFPDEIPSPSRFRKQTYLEQLTDFLQLLEKLIAKPSAKELRDAMPIFRRMKNSPIFLSNKDMQENLASFMCFVNNDFAIPQDNNNSMSTILEEIDELDLHDTTDTCHICWEPRAHHANFPTEQDAAMFPSLPDEEEYELQQALRLSMQVDSQENHYGNQANKTVSMRLRLLPPSVEEKSMEPPPEDKSLVRKL